MKNILLALSLMILCSCQETNQSKTTEDNTTITDNKTRKGPPGKEQFIEVENEAVAQEYKGIFTEDKERDNLFPIQATGISTEGIVKAGHDFIKTLNTQELKETLYTVDADQWRRWSNVDSGMYDRQGLSLLEMSQAQKDATWQLLQTSLSAKGLQLTKDIMKTDQTLKELTQELDRFDEELYFLTIMGEPSETEPWGWQFEGHHLVINYFVLGDQIVMSPVFMGAEPVITTSGKYEGNTLFQDEQNLGLAFMQSLSQEQQLKATVSKEKTGNNNIAAANNDNITVNYQGIAASDLNKTQQVALLQLIEQYVNNMKEGHQVIKMEEVRKHIDETWFSWVGETTDDSIFYYRIHSPVIYIEFDHQGPVAIKAKGSRDKSPTRNHIHTNVRTPNGNDYGKDLLQQHIQKHHTHD